MDSPTLHFDSPNGYEPEFGLALRAAGAGVLCPSSRSVNRPIHWTPRSTMSVLYGRPIKPAAFRHLGQHLEKATGRARFGVVIRGEGLRP